jgi:hypothetical protein
MKQPNCSVCGSSLPTKDKRSGRYQRYCNNNCKQQAYRNKHVYKISQEQYRELRINGVCAICGIKGSLVVDHNHQTGHTRGMLCVFCNAGLGGFRDRIQYLENAIAYLQASDEECFG